MTAASHRRPAEESDPSAGEHPGSEQGAGRRAHMPSDVTPHVNMFDQFATHIAKFASKAWFFSLCVLLVLVWAPSFFLIRNIDTWQLIINTATTIVTFL